MFRMDTVRSNKRNSIYIANERILHKHIKQLQARVRVTVKFKDKKSTCTTEYTEEEIEERNTANESEHDNNY